eukprot:TRINITY_DN122898_c0_g1_i1.p3 TRINITY_DN122898_c0_g1~~TRINITY_DN122898_c0_g1_i1.p3  ORF type:complete len:127 (+),score=17.21 TRINITY_DN122898_c0_g1_i1:80-460(+)
MVGLRIALLAVVAGLPATTVGLKLLDSSREMPLPPVCHSITCADVECVPPLELRRKADQCCPICWAPDDKIALDRHVNHGDLGYRRDVHPAAPSSCAGAKCFQPSCAPGQQVGHVSGGCCASCVDR